jgi:3-oxoacyl-[acyl-carrier protein] reductase
MSIKGKNAIVTGARTGIGRAVVELFARKGANIWAVVHREDQEWLCSMKDIAAENGVWIKPVYMDLSDDHSILMGIRGIMSEKLPIHILVNAAGIVGKNRLIQMTSLQDMRHVMQVNYFAAIQICQLVSRSMYRQKEGAIVNIASIAGIDGDLSQLEYGASKAALICATKKMAYEWGCNNIRVNAVAPGVTDTKMLEEMEKVVVKELVTKNPLQRVGNPKEIAELVLFLADDSSSYITAQTIRIDGGGYPFISTANRKAE